MPPFASATFAQHDVSVNCLCGCSSRSWPPWDLNPPANSPHGAQRSLLLTTLRWPPLPSEERLKPSPYLAFVSSRTCLFLPASKRDGPCVLKSPMHHPVSGPLHMLFLPPLCPQLPFGPQLACQLLELACPDLTTPGQAPGRCHQACSCFSFTPMPFVINCEASASLTRQ